MYLYGSGYATRRSASESNRSMYFPEVDVDVRGARARADEPDFRSVESCSQHECRTVTLYVTLCGLCFISFSPFLHSCSNYLIVYTKSEVIYCGILSVLLHYTTLRFASYLLTYYCNYCNHSYCYSVQCWFKASLQ